MKAEAYNTLLTLTLQGLWREGWQTQLLWGPGETISLWKSTLWIGSSWIVMAATTDILPE